MTIDDALDRIDKLYCVPYVELYSIPEAWSDDRRAFEAELARLVGEGVNTFEAIGRAKKKVARGILSQVKAAPKRGKKDVVHAAGDAG